MITSKENEQFKFWNKLKLKKYRDEYGLFLVYGKHLIEEAKKANAIREVITTDEKIDGFLISDSLMKLLSPTETAYDVCAVCYKKKKEVKSNRVLLLEDVQDPDNVGALLRSALAFGFRKVIFSLHTADLYNEKVVRASKGALFHLDVDRMDAIQAVKHYKELGYKVCATNVSKGDYSFNDQKVVLILGNEGKGVSQTLLNLSDEIISIKTQTVESLNVSVAGAILMYEWSKL